MITSKIFGITPDGTEVKAFTLTNVNGIELTAITYGCTITSLKTPDANGVKSEIVLGFDDLNGYLFSPHYVGCLIGRSANRIFRGEVTIDGKNYHLPQNFEGHHLHGGKQGFDKVVWHAETFENEYGLGIDFSYMSVDGDEGYPGNAVVIVRYLLTNNDAFIINAIVTTDQPTIVDLTQHTYFNLNSVHEDIFGHGLWINADQYLPIDADRFPQGSFQPVDQTPFDFRTPKLIGNAFDINYEQIRLGMGLDHSWLINKNPDELGHAVTLFSPETRRAVDVHTSEPGIHVYTGNALQGTGRGQVQYKQYAGVALETGHFPDSPHHPEYPSIVVRPDKPYNTTTLYRFSVIA